MSKASPAFDKRDFDAILSRTWSAMRHEIGAEEAKGGRQARRYRLSLRVSAGPEGGFTVTCPKLPPVATYGETLEEAQANAREAIELCLEVMREGRTTHSTSRSGPGLANRAVGASRRGGMRALSPLPGRIVVAAPGAGRL
jgi:predicted RNase H-like HicB family nuclease